MTTATINGKRKSISMSEKATLLSVSQIEGEPGYIVSSGSDKSKSYRVSEDVQHCNCEAWGTCSHRIAATTFKASQPRRVVTCGFCSGYHASSACWL